MTCIELAELVRTSDRGSTLIEEVAVNLDILLGRIVRNSLTDRKMKMNRKTRMRRRETSGLDFMDFG